MRPSGRTAGLCATTATTVETTSAKTTALVGGPVLDLSPGDEFEFKLNNPWLPAETNPEINKSVVWVPVAHSETSCPSFSEQSSMPAVRDTFLRHGLAFGCRNPFGQQNPFIARITAARSLIASMAQSVPEGCQQRAHNLLDAAWRSGIALMGVPMSIHQHAMNRIAEKLERVTPRNTEMYIGITESPCQRYTNHQASGYTYMVLYICSDSRQSGSLERSLLSIWRGHHQCVNQGPGGERASGGRPHFLYIVFRHSTGLLR